MNLKGLEKQIKINKEISLRKIKVYLEEKDFSWSWWGVTNDDLTFINNNSNGDGTYKMIYIHFEGINREYRGKIDYITEFDVDSTRPMSTHNEFGYKKYKSEINV